MYDSDDKHTQSKVQGVCEGRERTASVAGDRMPNLKMSRVREMKKNERRRQYRVIDLFCGAGGFSLGFAALPSNDFRFVWANDFDRDAADTYAANFGHVCVSGDILRILDDPKTKIPLADVVIGGPPARGLAC